MGFTLFKTTFNLNAFSKIFDFRALGLHIRDEHIFAIRSYLLRKCVKKKCQMDISFFGVEQTSFPDKLKSTVSLLTFIFNEV